MKGFMDSKGQSWRLEFDAATASFTWVCKGAAMAGKPRQAKTRTKPSRRAAALRRSAARRMSG